MEQQRPIYDFKTYKELETNLTIQKEKLRTMILDLNHFIASQGPKEYQSPDLEKIPCGQNIISVNDFYKQLLEKQKAIKEQQDYVNELDEGFKNLQIAIEEASKKFNDLELKVFVLRCIKNNSLLYISRVLKYSYPHIKRISQAINKQIYY